MEAGARLHAGVVTGILEAPDGKVSGIEVDGARLHGDAVVIALGPWSLQAARWLPLPPVFRLKGHSLVFQTGGRIPPQSLFAEVREAGGEAMAELIIDGAARTVDLSPFGPGRLRPLDPARLEVGAR